MSGTGGNSGSGPTSTPTPPTPPTPAPTPPPTPPPPTPPPASAASPTGSPAPPGVPQPPPGATPATPSSASETEPNQTIPIASTPTTVPGVNAFTGVPNNNAYTNSSATNPYTASSSLNDYSIGAVPAQTVLADQSWYSPLQPGPPPTPDSSQELAWYPPLQPDGPAATPSSAAAQTDVQPAVPAAPPTQSANADPQSPPRVNAEETVVVTAPVAQPGTSASAAQTDDGSSAFSPAAPRLNPFPDLSLNLAGSSPNVSSGDSSGDFSGDLSKLFPALTLNLTSFLSPDDHIASDDSQAALIVGWVKAAIMTAQWETGNAPALSVYGPDTQQTQDMTSAPGVQQALDAFYLKNALNGPDEQQALLGYNPGFGLSGLYNAGLNPTQQFVGNYSLDLYPQSDGTILIMATNTTSLTSLLYGVWPDAWNQPNGSPMGNSTQVYIWTVPNANVPSPP